MFLFLLVLVMLSSVISVSAAPLVSPYNEGNGNPLLPGYFADPSAYKFGDTFYIYATSDGYHVNQNAGWPVVWKSKDFVNWSAVKLDLRNPNGTRYDANAFFWAPSALEHNGKYYISFTKGDYFTMIAEGDSPDGEFVVLGNLFGTTDATFPKNKTIDSQLFKDDDGRVYVTYLWNQDPDKHSNTTLKTAIAELDPDDLTNVLSVNIMEELSNYYREGQNILKKDGKYYMLYSEGVWTGGDYHVRYAVADNILGPYQIKMPILVSNINQTIIGTGHNSVLQVDDRYFMVYHRQSYPMTNYIRRQTAVNEMSFNDDGTIKAVLADQVGVGKLGVDEEREKYVNIAGDATVITDDVSEEFKPEYINDDNYGTIWKTNNHQFPKQVTLDFEESRDIEKTELFFEYPSKYYQYTIDYSDDNANWTVYSDKSENRDAISPYADSGSISARYVRVTITGMQNMQGAYGGDRPPAAGIFEFKVYGMAPEETGDTDVPSKNILYIVLISVAAVAVIAAVYFRVKRSKKAS